MSQSVLDDSLTSEPREPSPDGQGLESTMLVLLRSARQHWTRVLIAAILVLAGGLLTWNWHSHSTAQSAVVVGNPGAMATTADQLPGLAKQLGHSIYWAGAQQGVTYEVTFVGRNLYVRSLPTGVAVGSTTPYLTVGTYEQANAYEGLVSASKVSGATSQQLRGGALVVVPAGKPTSAYFAFPNTTLLMEVYDPTAGESLKLVVSGAVQPINPA